MIDVGDGEFIVPVKLVVERVFRVLVGLTGVIVEVPVCELIKPARAVFSPPAGDPALSIWCKTIPVPVILATMITPIEPRLSRCSLSVLYVVFSRTLQRVARVYFLKGTRCIEHELHLDRTCAETLCSVSPTVSHDGKSFGLWDMPWLCLHRRPSPGMDKSNRIRFGQLKDSFCLSSAA